MLGSPHQGRDGAQILPDVLCGATAEWVDLGHAVGDEYCPLQLFHQSHDFVMEDLGVSVALHNRESAEMAQTFRERKELPKRSGQHQRLVQFDRRHGHMGILAGIAEDTGGTRSAYR